MTQLDISTEHVSGTLVVRPVGEIDHATAQTFGAAVLPVLKEQLGPVVMDLSRVTFLDSAGLAALVDCHRTARRSGGYFSMAGLTPFIAQLFKRTSLDAFFDIRPPVDPDPGSGAGPGLQAPQPL